jgi:predicted dehydrogenase
MLLSYSSSDLDDYRIVGTLGDLYSTPAFAMPGGFKHTVTIGESKTEESFTPTDQFGGELKYFSDCIVNDKHPEADGEEGMLDIRVIAAVQRALETGQSQQLKPYVRRRRPTEEQVQKLKKVDEPELVGVHQPSKGR